MWRFVASFFLFAATSAHADIYSYQNPAAQYIRVEENESRNFVKFSLCEHLPNHTSRCKSIGKPDVYYPKITLKLLRGSEKFDVVTSVVADAAILAGGIYLGAGAGAAIGYSVAASSMPLFYFEAGALAGIAASGAMAAAVDALNPYEQLKQLETITDEVLMDQTVIVDMELQGFAKRLSVVLGNLDQRAWMTIKNGMFQSVLLY